jgi:hypothetical protein
MFEYRFFRVDQKDRIQGQPRIISCRDDNSARIEALQLVDGCAIEIWDCGRKVAHIPSDEQHISEHATISS